MCNARSFVYRTILAAAACICVVVAGVVFVVPWRREQIAVHCVERAGAYVGYQRVDGAITKRPTIVDLSYCDVGDAVLPVLMNLTELRALSVAHTRVTGLGISCLSTLLALDLDGCEVNSRILKDVAGIRGIRCLHIASARIDDRDLDALRNCDLWELTLAETEITSVRALAQLPNLRMLCVADTHIADDDLSECKRMQALEYIDVSGTLVEGDGLMHLVQCKSLKTLVVGRNVAEEKITRFRREVPECEVQYPSDVVRRGPCRYVSYRF